MGCQKVDEMKRIFDDLSKAIPDSIEGYSYNVLYSLMESLVVSRNELREKYYKIYDEI